MNLDCEAGINILGDKCEEESFIVEPNNGCEERGSTADPLLMSNLAVL